MPREPKVGEMVVEATTSVVVPTRSRPRQVVAAVRSALDQTLAPLEVIVVVDGPDPETEAALAALDDPRVVVVRHEVSRGAGAARASGVARSRGDLVAFLDDDDVWLPGKLARQHAHLAAHPALVGGAGVVLGTCAVWDDGSDEVVWPTRAPAPGETVAHYLFVRDRPGEGVLATPTLLVSGDLARRVPFPTHLRAHEEWDWMLDLEAAGARFDVVLEPLVRVDARPRRASVSTSAGWRRSLAWALSRADELGDAFGAFVLTEVARTAVLDGAPARDHAAIAAVALTRPVRPRDVVRFAARPLALRRRARRRAGR